jgi:hypothetical protein
MNRNRVGRNCRSSSCLFPNWPCRTRYSPSCPNRRSTGLTIRGRKSSAVPTRRSCLERRSQNLGTPSQARCRDLWGPGPDPDIRVLGPDPARGRGTRVLEPDPAQDRDKRVREPSTALLYSDAADRVDAGDRVDAAGTPPHADAAEKEGAADKEDAPGNPATSYSNTLPAKQRCDYSRPLTQPVNPSARDARDE